MKKITLLTDLIRWFNIGLIVLTLLAYLTPYIHPRIISWFGILGLAYPYLLLLNIFMGLFWVFKKHKLALLSLICIVLGWEHLNAFWGVNFSSVPDKGKESLQIMTYNVRTFRSGTEKNFNERLETMKIPLNFIEEQQPDIFCGQEFRYPSYSKAMTKNIDDLLKVGQRHYAANAQSSLFILSKYPIVNKGEVESDPEANRKIACIFADIQISNALIFRVYNLHLESNKVSKQTESMELNTEVIQEKETWKTIFSVVSNIKNSQKTRANEAKLIAEHIKGSPYPVIVCGDFNDTPVSYTYHKIRGNLKDNFIERGVGIGSTYAQNLPFLRIDFIFSDNGFDVLTHKILRRANYSDHYPVVSTIAW